MRKLRAAEWLMLGVVLHGAVRVVARVGFGGFLRGTIDAPLRGTFIALAMLLVSTAKLGSSFWPMREKVPDRFWPPLRLALVFALLPVALGLWLVSVECRVLDWRSATPVDVMSYVWQRVLQVGGAGAAGLLPWLFVARSTATDARLSAGRAVRDGAAGFFAAVREWAPVGLAFPLYNWLDDIVGVPTHDFDPLMRSIDMTMFLGHDPAVEIQRFVWLPLSEWLAFSYAFYGVLFPLVLGAIFLRGGFPALRVGVTALCFVFAIGFSTYMMVPVKGPALSQPLELPVDLYVLKEVKFMMDAQRFTWDCFPSLHTACSLVLAWLSFRFARRVFWLTLPMVISTPVACVYLRYHYVIDCLAGAVLFALTIWATPRLMKRFPGEPTGTPPDASRSATA